MNKRLPFCVIAYVDHGLPRVHFWRAYPTQAEAEREAERITTIKQMIGIGLVTRAEVTQVVGAHNRKKASK